MRLSPQLRIIAWRLALQPLVTSEELIQAIWGEADNEPEWSYGAIKVRVSQLRKLLPEIEIKSRWVFSDYGVSEEQRPVLLAILADEIQRNADYRPLTNDQSLREAA